MRKMILTRYIDETDEEVDIEFEYHYSPGTRDYYTSDGLEPGDPEEFEPYNAKNKTTGKPVELSEEEIEEAMELVKDNLMDAAEQAQVDRHLSKMNDDYNNSFR